jgi:tetraacyldisaccharide 4'-kinase
MKTPAFWYEKPGALAWFLWPLGWLYGAVTAWRMQRDGERVALPVICVGNFTAGGAGKTPAVLMLAEALSQTGERPFVISRGYGGKLHGPFRVDPLHHTANDCGDEPMLLAAHVPTIVARDRVAGASFAQAEGATVILLDDGLQNPALTKDFTIAVVDGGVGIGNGFCVPAGPLRAPLRAQGAHVDCVLMIGSSDESFALKTSEKPLAFGHLHPDADAVRDLRGLQLLAFAGIGRPEKFFETLRESGLDVVQTRSFADHHPYSDADMSALKREAASRNLTLVTTEKDIVRVQSAKVDIKCLPVRLQLADRLLLDLVNGEIRIKHLKV